LNSTDSVTLTGSSAYFNHVAENYGSWYDVASPGGYALRVRRERVLELLANQGGRVLDVGCGPGVLAPDLRARGFTYWGIDAAPNMIAHSRSLFAADDRVQLAVSDARRLPFSDDFFDVVICLGVLDRLPGYEMAIQEMVRVIRTQGTLILAFPNLLSPYASWKKSVYYPVVARLHDLADRLRQHPRRPSLLRHFAKLHTPRGATALLTRAGARTTACVHYNFNVCLAPLEEWFPNLTTRLTRWLEVLRNGPFRWLGSGFLVQAVKTAPASVAAGTARRCVGRSTP
jgi:ubiquinone/menaquinone biosynthesis C-methylase UbiE